MGDESEKPRTHFIAFPDTRNSSFSFLPPTTHHPSMNNTPRFDVIVIGAGAAGLAAAATLSEAGKNVCILEARDRIGGRIFSRVEPDVPIAIELGAEFIHGRS